MLLVFTATKMYCRSILNIWRKQPRRLCGSNARVVCHFLPILKYFDIRG